LKGWQEPSYWVTYTPVWVVEKYAVVSRETGKVMFIKTNYRSFRIDPRGHFLMFRCAAIAVFMKIVGSWRWLGKPFWEFAEFFANYPTW